MAQNIAYNERESHFLINFWKGGLLRSETVYKNKLIKKLESLFPECYIIRNNPLDIQGIPDILILFKNRWAALEFKRSNTASQQANQKFYVDKFNDMSFAAFICPENEEEVLDALQLTFYACR